MGNNPQEVKDPDDISAETLQEKADIKREELREVDPNAFDVCNDGNIPPTPSPQGEIPVATEVVGDIDSLSLNEKYALILHQAKQLGPLFFVQVSPDTFKLPERDPLNLIWINILTGWHLASDILAKFEAAMVSAEAEATQSEEEGTDDSDNDDAE